MARVVITDNLGSDYPDEKFITVSLHESICKLIAKALNDDDPYASRYYKIVPDGYVLQPGFEP